MESGKYDGDEDAIPSVCERPAGVSGMPCGSGKGAVAPGMVRKTSVAENFRQGNRNGSFAFEDRGVGRSGFGYGVLPIPLTVRIPAMTQRLSCPSQSRTEPSCAIVAIDFLSDEHATRLIGES